MCRIRTIKTPVYVTYETEICNFKIQNNVYEKQSKFGVTFIVSRGCPTNKRQTPPTPPDTKFFRGETLLSDSTAVMLTYTEEISSRHLL